MSRPTWSFSAIQRRVPAETDRLPSKIKLINQKLGNYCLTIHLYLSKKL